MELMQRLNFEYGNEELIDKFICAVKKYPGSCDNVWFSTLYGHPKIQTHIEMAEKLKRSAKKLRDIGISVSMQISNTMGHGQLKSLSDFSGVNYENSPITKMVGHDGAVADFCYCWRNKHFIKYICDMASVYAERLKPDCVWVDDDFRPSNHRPVSFGCFCENCISKFNSEHGYSYNREGLVEDFLHGDIKIREQYIAFIREGMANLMKEICLAVKRVSPDSVMCYQHGAYGSFTGYGLDFVYNEMYENCGKAPMSRPGGGAYYAHNPNEIIDKAVYINWQNAMLPKYVKRTAPEIENTPYSRYGKTPATTAFETSHYLATGNTDMSYSMLRSPNEDYDFHEQELKLLSEQRAYWEKLSEYNKNSYQAGIRYFQTKYLWKRKLGSEEGIVELNREPYCGCSQCMTNVANVDFQWVRDGIPVSYDEKEEGVICIYPDIAKAIEPSEFEYLLTKNVITDAASIQILCDRGLDVGIKVKMLNEYEQPLVRRIFAEDKANKVQASGGFTPADTRYGLIYPTDDMEVLAKVDTDTSKFPPFTDSAEYPCGVAECVFETSKGAKWAVFGIALWNGVVNSRVITRILDIADHISGNALAARLLTLVQAVLMPRKNDEGNTVCVSITNCTIGKSGEITLLIRNPRSESFKFMSQYNGECELAYEKRGDDYIVKIPSLEPWSVGSVFVE